MKESESKGQLSLRLWTGASLCITDRELSRSPNEQRCLRAKPQISLFCSETITIHKLGLLYIVICKSSTTLKRLRLSLDISAHEEFRITLFSWKPHTVQYITIQTISQASTLSINCNCIQIMHCLVKIINEMGTLQDNN